MNDNDMDWAVLARYLADDVDAAERARVERWLAADPANGDALATFSAVTSDADWTLPAEQEAGILAAVEREMTRAAKPAARSREHLSVVAFPAPARSSRLVPMLKRAAVVALVATGAGAVYWSVKSSGSPVATVAEGRAFATARGQRATFRLADGSRVILGPASTLRTSRDFGRGAREVELDGAAYFEVKHDARHPFVVRAGELVATDLGTAFTVRAYTGEAASAQVVVREGLVAIQAAGADSTSRRVITPGQMGWLDATRAPIVQSADTTLQFAWVAGKLVFRTTPLRDAIREIRRWHDVDIRLASPELGARGLTASFRDESIDEVLRVVATALDLEVVGDGQPYTLRAR